jgi:dTDP-4-amino-4,6-dideoxygalactose transaminase
LNLPASNSGGYPQIPLLNLKRQTQEIRQQLDAAIASVLDSGQFILGPDVQALERRVAALCQTSFAIGCASGSDAISLALMALGVAPGGFGDGGMITTNDASLAEKLLLLRVHGSRVKYFHEIVGINSRLDSLQAAILLVKLDFLHEWNNRRRANADAYRALLKEALGDKVGLPVEQPDCCHVYNQFTIRVPDRDLVRSRLAKLGVASEIYYPVPLHLQQCFSHLGYRVGDLPVSEASAGQVMSIPVDPSLLPSEIESVVARLSIALADGASSGARL